MIESMSYIWECGPHCALRNGLQEKLQAAGIDHGRSIRNILAMRNMVPFRLIFEYSKDMGFTIKSASKHINKQMVDKD
jgi:hypothetical protein